MNLDLNDLQTDVLIRELSQIVQNDRYRLSPRIVALKEILAKLRQEPERQLLPLLRHYEPPSGGATSGVRLASASTRLRCDRAPAADRWAGSRR